MPRRDTLAAASGRWPQILADLGGIRPEQLCRREGPCPNCGGSTRFRWDQDDGNGAWHCSHCGGGTGIDLLMRVRRWSFAEALVQVDLHLSRAHR
jgi:putative DNA primase/helicase